MLLNKDKSPETRAKETHQKQRQHIKDIVLKNMEGRPMPLADYDSKFQFFYPEQKYNPSGVEAQLPAIDNSSVGSYLPDSLQPNAFRKPEQLDPRNIQQSMGIFSVYLVNVSHLLLLQENSSNPSTTLLSTLNSKIFIITSSSKF